MQQIYEHIRKVNTNLIHVAQQLLERAENHDADKLEINNLIKWREYIPELEDAEKQYGYASPEYKRVLEHMKPLIEKHCQSNDHHPEFFEKGINAETEDKGIIGMSLMQLIEMFCDWKAASERYPNGNLERSIRINAAKYNLSYDLTQVLLNTVGEI